MWLDMVCVSTKSKDSSHLDMHPSYGRVQNFFEIHGFSSFTSSKSVHVVEINERKKMLANCATNFPFMKWKNKRKGKYKMQRSAQSFSVLLYQEICNKFNIKHRTKWNSMHDNNNNERKNRITGKKWKKTTRKVNTVK